MTARVIQPLRTSKIPYKETVWMNWWLSVLLTIVILLLSGALLGRELYGQPIEPVPIPAYALLALDLLIIGVFLNFRKLDIEASPEGVKTNYGILRTTIHASDIVSCKPTRTKLPLYGGLGLRLGANDWPGYKSGNAIEITRKTEKPSIIPTNKPVELSQIVCEISKPEAKQA